MSNHSLTPTYDGHVVDIIGIDADAGKALIKTDASSFLVDLKDILLDQETALANRVYDNGDRCTTCEHILRYSQAHPYGDTVVHEPINECHVLDHGQGECPVVSDAKARLNDPAELADILSDHPHEVAEAMGKAFARRHRSVEIARLYAILLDLAMPV